MATMTIRDSFATINGDKTVHEMPSGGICIVADDGQTLFDLRLTTEGHLEITPGSVCKHQGKLLDDKFVMWPRASNVMVFMKPEYEKKR